MDIKRDGNWVEGSAGKITILAKVHDFSICTHLEANGKAISKMSVSEDGNQVYHYDRGLDFDSTSPEQKIVISQFTRQI